ncbi:MAG TPA: ATP-grasp domain-containing protein [Azospirillum sp.]
MNILLVSVGIDWISVARLPKPLRGAGFTVLACCPEGSLLDRSGFLHGGARLRPPVTPESVWTALRHLRGRWGGSFVVPGDEPTIRLLHGFLQRPPADADDTDRAVLADLAASLGDPDMHDAVSRKSYLCALSDNAARRFPPQAAVDHTTNVFALADRIGYPLVLKKDFSAGGTGVFEIGSVEALEDFVARSNAFLRHGRRDARPHAGQTGVVQRLLSGRSASVSLVAMRGRVVAAFAYAKVAGGPARMGGTSVAGALQRPDLIEAARDLTAHFGFTGFAGVDFLLDNQTDEAYVLEFNARPTLTSHLGHLFGADLCAALAAALSNRPPPAPGKALPLVSLFPSEWQRDPASRYLAEAHHDVPWDDPALLKALFEMGYAGATTGSA